MYRPITNSDIKKTLVWAGKGKKEKRRRDLGITERKGAENILAP